MKYRVVFMQRNDGEGNPIEDPRGYVELHLADGVVQDSAFVERGAALNLHAQEAMTGDDGFLSVGTEVWEYDVAGGREREFTDALRNSRMVIDFQTVDDGLIDQAPV